MTPIVRGAAAAAAALVLATSALAADGGRPISIALTPEEEPGGGDPTGSGTFDARINPGTGQVCYTLTASLAAPATAAHIHRGPTGVAGGIVVHLATPTGGSSSGCATVDRTLAKELIQSPEEFYVNVHNDPFPAGAVRGQLAK